MLLYIHEIWTTRTLVFERISIYLLLKCNKYRDKRGGEGRVQSARNCTSPTSYVLDSNRRVDTDIALVSNSGIIISHV